MAIEEQGIIFAIDVKGQEKLDQVDKAVDKLGANNEKTKASFFSLSGAIGNASNEIKNKITSVFPEAERIIEATGGGARRMGSGMVEATKGTKTLVGGIRALTVAMVSTGIGAIFVAIGLAIAAFVNYVSKLAPVLDKIEQLAAGASAAFTALGQRVGLITGALTDLFRLPIGQYFSNIKDAIAGTAKEMGNAAVQAASLKKQFQDLEDNKAVFDLGEKQVRAQIASLLIASKDLSKPLSERERLFKEAIKLEQGLVVTREQLQKYEQEIFLAQVINSNKAFRFKKGEIEQLRRFDQEGLKLAKKLEDDFLIIDTDKYKAIAEQGISARRESDTILEKAVAKTNALIEKQKAAREKAAEEARKAAEKQAELEAKSRKIISDENLAAIEDDTTRQIEALNIQYDEKIKAVEEGVKDPREREAFRRVLAANTADAINAIIEDGQKKLAALKAQREKEIKELSFDPLTDKTDNGLDDVKAITGRNNLNLKLQQIDDDANKTAAEKEKEAREKAAREILQGTTDLYSQISDARIQSIDNEINAQEQKIGRFRELAEFGTAEQLQLEEERLNELQIKREREIERNRKIAAAQIAINQAVTISGAISGVVEAFRTDPTGITTILKTVALAATIAGLTASLGSVFGNLPAFKEGTPYVNGEGTETSDSILARLSKGERVLNAKQNRAIGAISNEDLTYYVKLGQSISDIEPQSRAADYTNQFNELVHENRLMRKKLDRLEIKMGITSEGIYGMITTLNDKENRKAILKA